MNQPNTKPCICLHTFISHSTKVLYAIIAVVLAFAFSLDFLDHGASPILLIALIISLFFIVFNQAWDYDTKTARLIFYYALPFRSAKKEWKAQEIEAIFVRHFEQGIKKEQWVRIEVAFLDRNKKVIEVGKQKKVANTISALESIRDLKIIVE